MFNITTWSFTACSMSYITAVCTKLCLWITFTYSHNWHSWLTKLLTIRLWSLHHLCQLWRLVSCNVVQCYCCKTSYNKGIVLLCPGTCQVIPSHLLIGHLPDTENAHSVCHTMCNLTVLLNRVYWLRVWTWN